MPYHHTAPIFQRAIPYSAYHSFTPHPLPDTWMTQRDRRAFLTSCHTHNTTQHNMSHRYHIASYDIHHRNTQPARSVMLSSTCCCAAATTAGSAAVSSAVSAVNHGANQARVSCSASVKNVTQPTLRPPQATSTVHLCPPTIHAWTTGPASRSTHPMAMPDGHPSVVRRAPMRETARARIVPPMEVSQQTGHNTSDGNVGSRQTCWKRTTQIPHPQTTSWISSCVSETARLAWSLSLSLVVSGPFVSSSICRSPIEIHNQVGRANHAVFK